MDDFEDLLRAADASGSLPSVRPPFRSSVPVGVASEIAATGMVGAGETFEPGAIRYIKLGENGKWASKALEQGVIPFGYRAVDHHSCLVRDWDEVRRQLIGMGRTAQG